MQKSYKGKKYKTLTRHYETKVPQNAVDLILCWPFIAGHGSGPNSGLYTQWELEILEKTNFLFASSYQLELAFGLGMWAWVHFPFQHWDPIRPRPVQIICIPSQPLWAYMFTSPAIFRRPCFLRVLHPLWLLKSFHFLFHRVPWTLRGGIWWKHSFHLVFQGFPLCTLSSCGCESLYLFPSSVERSFSDEGLMKCDTDLWIYQILLGVILLLCVLVVVFGFL